MISFGGFWPTKIPFELYESLKQPAAMIATAQLPGGRMKALLAPILAVTLAVSASTAFAGGPVIVVEEPEVVADTPASGAVLPLLLVGIALCIALCGGDDDEPVGAQQTATVGDMNVE
jgi:hypothetical protein